MPKTSFREPDQILVTISFVEELRQMLEQYSAGLHFSMVIPRWENLTEQSNRYRELEGSPKWLTSVKGLLFSVMIGTRSFTFTPIFGPHGILKGFKCSCSTVTFRYEVSEFLATSIKLSVRYFKKELQNIGLINQEWLMKKLQWIPTKLDLDNLHTSDLESEGYLYLRLDFSKADLENKLSKTGILNEWVLIPKIQGIQGIDLHARTLGWLLKHKQSNKFLCSPVLRKRV